MEKIELYVRFANESVYTKILINPNNVTDINEIGDETFFTIDNIRVATPSTEWEKVKNKYGY